MRMAQMNVWCEWWAGAAAPRPTSLAAASRPPRRKANEPAAVLNRPRSGNALLNVTKLMCDAGQKTLISIDSHLKNFPSVLYFPP
jgi:hypothetical protein